MPLIAGRYKLMEKIGQGGMGIVHHAQDRLTGTEVALKRVTRLEKSSSALATPTLVHVPDALRVALANEFRTLAQLRHPYIITVLDYGFDTSRKPFFTMEYLPGAQTIIAAAKQAERPQQVQLLMQMLQALDFLHRRQIYHRDIKPGNVLVTPEGRVKLLDFGLSIIRGRRDTDPTLTVGTFAYMAPELIRQQKTTPASDLYSAGVIAYELFTGEQPFTASSVSKLLTDVMTRPPSLDNLKGVDPKLINVLGRLLSKDPNERYQTAQQTIAALAEATGHTLPAETVAIRDSYLRSAQIVGREGELRILQAALSSSLSGSGEAWLIGGESGVGKSRLLSEIRTLALVEGALVVEAQATEGGDPLWRDVLRRLLLSVPVSDEAAGVLKGLVPDISTLLERPIPDAPDLTSIENRARLKAVLSEVFEAITTPVVIIMEDIHWLSDTGRDLLNHAVKFVKGRPLMILASYQDDITPDLPTALPGFTPFTLRRLAGRAVDQLGQALLGEAGDHDALLELLKRETEGNPLFMVEVMRSLAEEAGSLEAITDLDLPHTVAAGGVQRVIDQRLARLTTDHLPLLRAAAVAGHTLDAELLRRLPLTADVDAFLLEAANATIIKATGYTWQFAHNQLRRAVLDAIPAAHRPTLHRQVADAIEAAPTPTAQVEALAVHWEAAGEAAKAATYYQQAGQEALDTSANSEARTFLEKALRLTDDAAARAHLALLMGRTLSNLSDYAAAEKHFTAARDQYAALKDVAGQAQAVAGLGRVAEARADYDTARQHYQQALEQFPVGAADIPATHTALGVIAYRQNRYEQALEHTATARQRFEAHDDPAGLATVLRTEGAILHATGKTEEGLARWDRALTLFRQVGNRQGVAAVLNNLGLAAEQAGQHADARSYYERSLRIKRETGDRRSQAITLNNLSVVEFSLANYAQAVALLEEAVPIFDAIGDQQGVADAYNNIGLIQVAQGEFAQAGVNLLKSRQLCEAIGDRWGVALTHLNMGKVKAGQGQPTDALTEFRQAIRVAHEIGLETVILQTVVEIATLDTLAPNEALALLHLATTHEATPGTERQRAKDHLATLTDRLPPAVVEAASKEGQSLTLKAIIERYG